MPDVEHVVPLDAAALRRTGRDWTIVAWAAMVPKALAAADRLERLGIDASVIDVRSLVPLDTRTILGDVRRTGRLFTVEVNPRLCGVGGGDRLHRGRRMLR